MRHKPNAIPGLPDAAFCWQLFAHKDLDGGGFAGPVGTNHGHSAHLRDGKAHIHDCRFRLGGVGECDIVHAKDHFAATFHAFQRTWFWESKLHGLVADLEVRILLGMFLHKLRQTGAFRALERFQLAVLEIDNVCAHFV